MLYVKAVAVAPLGKRHMIASKLAKKQIVDM
jgi:hypothetical protein